MNIGIVGGGINGLCCAWRLAEKGHEVYLYERDRLMQATSSASSKLLHGGLRYLENGEFRLVREAIRERDAWVRRVPELAKPLRLVMPIYRYNRRSRFIVGAGLYLYDHWIGKSRLPGAVWLKPKTILDRDPSLNEQDLVGGYEFSDGQMDDYALGLWVAEQAKAFGAQLHELTPVESINPDGLVKLLDHREHRQHDRVLNIAGPWAKQLLEQSGLKAPYQLDLVRGSHLVLEKYCAQAYLLEVPNERRILFVLPWKGQTLLGTTEVRQSLTDPIRCSQAEKKYLLDAYRYYFRQEALPVVVSTFAGVRPLLYSSVDPSRATREYSVQRTDKLITVFGGKWTTAVALANKVVSVIEAR